MTTVSLPKYFSNLFAGAHDNFTTIIGKPSDDDVQRLFRHNFQVLQDIDLGDGTGATRLILSKVDHKAENENQVFDRSEGALEAYGPSIQYDNNNSIRLCQEKKWSCKLGCQAAIRTAKHVGEKFVLSRVEEMWLVHFKN